MTERVDTAATKKLHPESLQAEERYVQGELYVVLGRGKKKSNKGIHQITTSEQKAVEKKPSDFESTDVDRISCKGTHYFMEA